MISEERLRQLWDRVSATTLTTQIHDAMRAVEAEARKAALERAAQQCEIVRHNAPLGDYTEACSDCAAAIRALKDA